MKNIINRPKSISEGLPEELLQEIVESRKRRKWSQAELAERVGLHQSQISLIESGGVVPRFNTVLELVRILELELVLIPKALVPMVKTQVWRSKNPNAPDRPLYAAPDSENVTDWGLER